MRIVDWNISYMGNHIGKLDFLFSHLQNDYCVMLQEVKPDVYEYIKSKYSENCQLLYSLNYRQPSKFDSNARKLGVLIILSNDIEILEAGVIERSLFPDRTIYATVKNSDKVFKILNLHSITGCSYYKAKSVQFDSFAEFIDNYSPDIIGIDANEPKIDSYDMSKMVFFDNGKGAQTFFNTIKQIGLVDAYVSANHICSDVDNQPITISHHIKHRGNVRYDFILAKDKLKIDYCKYIYDESIAAGSDHALIIADIIF